jgi:hypothetical protein
MSNENREVWRKRIDDLARSGLTVAKWCELNGTTPRQYGYWRKKLGSAAKQRTAPAKWVAVAIAEPAPSPTSPSGLTVRIAGAEIPLQPGFDPVLLRAVVEALGAAPC